MFKRITTNTARMALAVALLLGLLGLLGLGQAVLAGDIDGTNKFAWSTNAGWLNFNADPHGTVTVYADHLEGYAYGENIGWVRMGTQTSGSPHTYANDAAGTYGVNNDGVGNLSGYAWGTNVGWINFAPANGGVTVDPVTGNFDGYAYGENIGWIRFQGASPAYKVKAGLPADPTESLVAGHKNDIAAIITTRRPGPAASTGLAIGNNSFLNQAGDGIIFGHDGATGVSLDDLPTGVADRWARSWDFAVHDGGGSGGTVNLTFDFADAGIGATPVEPASNYVLLKRSLDSDPFADITDVSGANVSISGDQVIFSGVDVTQLGSFFTLGSTSGTLAVTLGYFLAEESGDAVNVVWQTASESGLAGFHLYAEGETTPLNSALIPSPVIDAVTPTAYRQTIQTTATLFYLEEIGIDGATQRHGPFVLGEAHGVYAVDLDGEEEMQSIFLPVVVR